MAKTIDPAKTGHRKTAVYASAAAAVCLLAFGASYALYATALVPASRQTGVFVLESSPLQAALAALALLAIVSLVLLFQLVRAHRDRAVQAGEEIRRTRTTIHDPITGLLTASTLHGELQSGVDQDLAGSAAVVAFEIARLDVLRRTAGDSVADLLLVEVGRTLRSFGSQLQLVSRVEDGTFVAVVDCPDKAQTPMQVIRGLREALGGYRQIGGQRVHVQLGFGVSLVPEDGTAAETLVAGAIGAARQALDGQSTGVRFVSPDYEDKAAAREKLKLELPTAIGRKDIIPFFQPIVTLEGVRPVGLEILSRWKRGRDKMVAVGDLLSIAEESGQMKPVTLSVLESAIRHVKRWSPELYLSLNMSPDQMNDEALPVELLNLLQAEGFPPERLNLELMERTFATDNPVPGRVVERLRMAGVKIVLDDFGRGTGNLAVVFGGGFDKLKIDRSYTSALLTSEPIQRIVGSILAFAKTGGIEVTAEGVETEEVAGKLLSLGCGVGQGYLYSAPVDAQATAAFLTKVARS